MRSAQHEDWDPRIFVAWQKAFAAIPSLQLDPMDESELATLPRLDDASREP